MTEPRQSGEFHHADPAYRKQMVVCLVASIVVGVLLLFALQQWLGHLATTFGGDPDQMRAWLQRIFVGVCLLLAATGFGFAAYIHRVAKQTRQERRWPPIGMRTTRAVRIRYLTSADALVSQLMLSAAALAITSLIVLGYALWLLRTA